MRNLNPDGMRDEVGEPAQASELATEAHLAAAAQHIEAAAKHRNCAFEHTFGTKESARDYAHVARGDSERAHELSEHAYRQSV